jgi:hypothetical protein
LHIERLIKFILLASIVNTNIVGLNNRFGTINAGGSPRGGFDT